MGVQYVQVTEEDGEEPIELPSEEDGTLLLTTLAAQYPGACGLQYRNPETGARRGIRLAEGKLHPPDGQWKDTLYICVFPKETIHTNGDTSDDNSVIAENKRKGDDGLENPTAKTKRVEKRKCSDLIVLGLPWKSSEEDIKKYFETFGEVIMVQIKRDPHTKQSRGYGFIRFSEYDSQITCLKKRHMIDGRWCEVRIPNSKVSIQEGPRKVFVGRTTEDMTADDLRQHFSRHGEVLDVFIPKPFRAFAFVTFSDSEVAQSLLGEDHLINGCSVHISAAAPKNSEKNQQDRKQLDHMQGQFQKQQQNWGGGQKRGGPPGGLDMGGMGQMALGMGPFQLNPAVVAAALGQAGLGLLNFANQGQNQGPPSDQGSSTHGGGHSQGQIHGGQVAQSNQSFRGDPGQGQGQTSQNSSHSSSSPGNNFFGWGGGPNDSGSSNQWGGGPSSNKGNWN